jgi:hypothetical protein
LKWRQRLAIGSELGTTIKIVMAGSRERQTEKSGWGNFVQFVGIVVFIFLNWLIIFIQDVVKIKTLDWPGLLQTIINLCR